MDLNNKALSDMTASSNRIVLEDNLRTSARIVGRGEPKLGEHAQVNTEMALREFLAQYEAAQKEQARENRINRIINGVAILIAAVSMVISLVK